MKSALAARALFGEVDTEEVGNGGELLTNR